MNRFQKAASFGARMGKAAGAPLELAGPPYMPRYTPETLPRPKPEDGKAYTWRENDIYKTRQELYRKGQAARAAAGATGPGTTKAIMKDGVIQPGAMFTPQGSMAPKDIDWSNIKLPQEQPLPAKSPVIESKTPKKLF
jgi:hypothetical protein